MTMTFCVPFEYLGHELRIQANFPLVVLLFQPPAQDLILLEWCVRNHDDIDRCSLFASDQKRSSSFARKYINWMSSLMVVSILGRLIPTTSLMESCISLAVWT